MSLLTYLFGKGYTGGPDFSRVETFHFDLEGVELELTACERKTPIKRYTVPFRKPGWFDEHCFQLANHFFVTVFGQPWAYHGPYWKVLNEPFGVLDIGVAVKRALPGKVLNPSDLDTLADAIRWDYEWYFEVEEQGKYGRGHNREVRQKAEKRFNALTIDEIGREQRAAYLKRSLSELPTQFETRSYGDQTWLYYALNKEPTYPAHYYCQALDEQYYLHVRFGYRVDFSNYFHIWKADAEAAEQRIIETVKLRFPGNATPT